MTRRYPLAPLLALTGWTFVDHRLIAPCNGEEYRLRREHGVTERTADRLAIAAGLHPHLVWPEMAEHAMEDHLRACEAEGCPERFMPPDRAPHARYCSPTCRRREKMRRYRARPHGAEANREHRRRYYSENSEYERARWRAWHDGRRAA